MRKTCLYVSWLLIAVFVVSCGGGGGDGGGNTAHSTGTATLTWTAPTTNADGSPLTDLAGFKIHYGTSSGSYTQTIDAGNVTTYQVSSIPRGATYYFVVTACNQGGVESDPSSEGSKTIN